MLFDKLICNIKELNMIDQGLLDWILAELDGADRSRRQEITRELESNPDNVKMAVTTRFNEWVKRYMEENRRTVIRHRDNETTDLFNAIQKHFAAEPATIPEPTPTTQGA